MSLHFSAAQSSRVTKKSQSKIPSLRRSASSPFITFKQRKPLGRSLTKPETTDENEDFFGDRLEETAIVKSLSSDPSLQDVAQIIQYIHFHAFESIPEGGGFNSTKISDILNYRKSLPSTVTVAHVHALTGSPTKTEREIADLIRQGTVRKVIIPGRGTGSSSIGDGLILFKNIENLADAANGLERGIANKFLHYLKANPMAHTISRTHFSLSEVTALMQAGFLTSSCQSQHAGDAYTLVNSALSEKATSIRSVSQAASGSVAAVGGERAIDDAGGRAGFRRSDSQLQAGSDRNAELNIGQELRVSLPNMGPYLKLLTAARSHMVSLIMKSKFREVPLYLLKERWDGGVPGDDPAAKAKKYRGEFAGVLPSRTRKWKQFYGLTFDWVLCECLGAGLVEVFETRSVGRAIRIA
ncbi:hypothetical protein ACLMJK_005846 [Lecanora helva]